MEKTYTASFVLDGQIIVRNFEGYITIKALKADIHANGGKVRFICKPEDFDKACEDYYWKLERARNTQRALRNS